ncbi:hypothetical protein GRAN_3126 [Granulicella sibirica]|uniref:Uncharacterized protein n=1 Tax=Granulicella sibirica TaxID=2479048 RepID=A0A4Q0T2V7_9BACT|nr:hypothetical protein GRAN_3126 [Granulicella sibirica]
MNVNAGWIIPFIIIGGAQQSAEISVTTQKTRWRDEKGPRTRRGELLL